MTTTFLPITPEQLQAQGEAENLVPGSRYRIRDGYQELFRTSDVIPYTEVNARLLGSASASAQGQDGAYHYLLLRAELTSAGWVVLLRDPLWQVVSVTSLGPIPATADLYLAQQNQQVIVSGPGFPFTLWGVVGSQPVRATKVASRNPDTSALEVPTGLVCAFGDRVVIAQDNILFISDPGTELRTFTTAGIVPLDARILWIGQVGAQGPLLVATEDGLVAIPITALGQGQAPQAFLLRQKGWQASDFRQVAVVGGKPIGCGTDTLVDLDAVLPLERPSNALPGRRILAPALVPPGALDFRTTRMYGCSDGSALVAGLPGDRILQVSPSGSQVFTFSAQHELNTLVGTLRRSDGHPLFVTSTSVLQQDTGATMDSPGFSSLPVASTTRMYLGSTPAPFALTGVPVSPFGAYGLVLEGVLHFDTSDAIEDRGGVTISGPVAANGLAVARFVSAPLTEPVTVPSSSASWTSLALGVSTAPVMRCRIFVVTGGGAYVDEIAIMNASITAADQQFNAVGATTPQTIAAGNRIVVDVGAFTADKVDVIFGSGRPYDLAAGASTVFDLASNSYVTVPFAVQPQPAEPVLARLTAAIPMGGASDSAVANEVRIATMAVGLSTRASLAPTQTTRPVPRKPWNLNRAGIDPYNPAVNYRSAETNVARHQQTTRAQGRQQVEVEIEGGAKDIDSVAIGVEGQDRNRP